MSLLISLSRRATGLALVLGDLPLRANAVKHFVAKLVKSFGGLCNAAESLDDFRYRKVYFQKWKMLHSFAWERRAKRGEGEVPKAIARVSSPSPIQKARPSRTEGDLAVSIEL